jgi:hypothetical protein
VTTALGAGASVSRDDKLIRKVYGQVTAFTHASQLLAVRRLHLLYEAHQLIRRYPSGISQVDKPEDILDGRVPPPPEFKV